MKKFTLSLLVILVSIFFIGRTALGQTLHGKTDALAEPTTPVENMTKSTDSFNLTDIWSIDFEDKEDWEFDFTPWTVNDVDKLNTIFIVVNIPHEGEPMAFIVANPTTTVPPMDPINWPQAQPHTGEQCGVCISAIPELGEGNNDWFISAMVHVNDGAYFNFWAHSFDDTDGLDRFNVAVSTTTPDPGEFTIISGLPYVEAPVEWTEYNYDLSYYAGQDIYVAIQCVSYGATAFVIDDLLIDPGITGIDGDQIIENITTNIYPNPFSLSTTIEYELFKASTADITIFNHLGQIVERSSLGDSQPGIHQYVWNALGMPAGIYFVQVRAGNEVTTRKMIKQ